MSLQQHQSIQHSAADNDEDSSLDSFNNGLGFNQRAPGKRLRVPTSCSICRRRKIKCDRERPSCTSCVKSKIQHLCEYKEPSWIDKRPRNGSPPQLMAEANAGSDASPDMASPQAGYTLPAIQSSLNNLSLPLPFPQQQQQSSSSSSSQRSALNVSNLLNIPPLSPQQNIQLPVVSHAPHPSHVNTTVLQPLRPRSQGSSPESQVLPPVQPASFQRYEDTVPSSVSNSASSTNETPQLHEIISNLQERVKVLESNNEVKNTENFSQELSVEFGFDVDKKLFSAHAEPFDDFKSLYQDPNFKLFINGVKSDIQNRKLKFTKIFAFTKLPEPTATEQNKSYGRRTDDDELYNGISRCLPPKQQSLSLISKYFEFLHPIYPILNKSELLHEIENGLFEKDSGIRQDTRLVKLGLVMMVLQLSQVCCVAQQGPSTSTSTSNQWFELAKTCLDRYQDDFDELDRSVQFGVFQLKLLVTLYLQMHTVTSVSNFINNDLKSADVSVLLGWALKLDLHCNETSVKVWTLITELVHWYAFKSGVPLSLNACHSHSVGKAKIIERGNRLLLNRGSSTMLDAFTLVNQIDQQLASRNCETLENILSISSITISSSTSDVSEESVRISLIHDFAQLCSLKLKLQSLMLDSFVESSDQRQLFVPLNTLLETSAQINIDLLSLFKNDQFFGEICPLPLVGSSLLTLLLTVTKCITKVFLKLNWTLQSLETRKFHHCLSTIHDSSIQLVQLLLSRLKPSDNTVKLSALCTVLKELTSRSQSSAQGSTVVLMKEELSYLSSKASKLQTLKNYADILHYSSSSCISASRGGKLDGLLNGFDQTRAMVLVADILNKFS